MKLQVVHSTEYHYESDVTLSHNEVYLCPRSQDGQLCLDHRLDIDPQPEEVRSRVDSFGNVVASFSIEEPHSRLRVAASSLLKNEARCPPDASETAAWETVREALAAPRGAEALEAYACVVPSPYATIDPAIEAYALPSFSPGRPILDAALELTGRIFRDFTYDETATSVTTSVHEALEMRRGVCQDFAHVAISCLRSMGLAARYVSGYLETIPPEGEERLVGADQSHAWFSVWSAGLGWIDLDPTNDLIPSTQHVTLAKGRDYSDVTPVRGVVSGGGAHWLDVRVDVHRL